MLQYQETFLEVNAISALARMYDLAVCLFLTCRWSERVTGLSQTKQFGTSFPSEKDVLFCRGQLEGWSCLTSFLGCLPGMWYEFLALIYLSASETTK